jgi:hypothetical protein
MQEVAIAPAVAKGTQPMCTRHGGFLVTENSYNSYASVHNELVRISGSIKRSVGINHRFCTREMSNMGVPSVTAQNFYCQLKAPRSGAGAPHGRPAVTSYLRRFQSSRAPDKFKDGILVSVSKQQKEAGHLAAPVRARNKPITDRIFLPT